MGSMCMSDELLTPKEAAVFLKVCRGTFNKLPVPSHPLPGTTRRRYLKSELVAWVKASHGTPGRLELRFRTHVA